MGGALRRRLLLPRRRGPRGRRHHRPAGSSRSGRPTPGSGRAPVRSAPSTSPTSVPRRRLPGRAAAGLGGPHLVRHPGRSRRHRRPGERAGRGHRPRRGGRQLPGGRRAGRLRRDGRGALPDVGRPLRPATGRLACAVRPGRGAEARPARPRQRHHADRPAGRPGGDHRQRRAADERGLLRHRRPGGEVCRAPVFEQGRERHRELARLGRATASSSRTTTATPARRAPCSGGPPQPGSPASTSTATAAPSPGPATRSRRRRCRRCPWPTGWSTRTRSGRLVGRGGVVPHRHRRPHRPHRLQRAHRHWDL